jgi:hypothetical protein
MPKEIIWLDDWQLALAKAKEQDKSIFLDFFSPT